jgi:hypothetical protein
MAVRVLRQALTEPQQRMLVAVAVAFIFLAALTDRAGLVAVAMAGLAVHPGQPTPAEAEAELLKVLSAVTVVLE